mgnify:CR=1 FL=1
MTALVQFRNVGLGYAGGPQLVPSFDLTLPKGAFVGIVGPNGAGKTTLMRTMCGVMKPQSGKVTFPSGPPRVGYVPQQSRLDPLFPLSAQEVVTQGMLVELSFWQSLGPEHRERARQALETHKIGALADQPFRDLSGGQRQRVLLARALVSNPDLLALDEPTAAMDAVAAQRLYDSLQSELSENRTVVLISHDLARTASMADHLILLSRERNIIRAGQTDEIMTSAVLSEVFGAHVHVEEHDCHYMVDFHLHPECKHA